MKVIALVGSPRRQGNTDLLVSRILEGAASNGNNIEKIYLYELEIKPCLDCRTCKKGSFQCPQEDDMTQIYQKLEESDVIVFGTPLYWYGPSAKTKLLIDRLRPYVASKKLLNKKTILVVPSEEGAKACLPLVEMFRNSFGYLGLNLLSQVLVKAYEKGEIGSNFDVMTAAFKVGKELSN